MNVHRSLRCEAGEHFYMFQPYGQYQFQVGDFGLCNRIVDAGTFAGSRLYMPPSWFQKGLRHIT